MLLVATIIFSIACLFLGFIVYIPNRKNATRILFALLCLSISFWAITNYYSIFVELEEMTLFLMRIVMALAVIQSISFFLLIHTFPSSKILLSKKRYRLILFMGVLTFFVAVSPILFTSLKYENGQATPVVGPGMLLFIIVAIGSLILGFTNLIIKFKRSDGILRQQLIYILLGTLLMFLGIVVFNFGFVVFLNNAVFMPYAVFFTLPFVGFTTYAVIRHRFMDIRAVLSRSIIYFFLVLFVAAMFTVVTVLIGMFFQDVLGANSLLITIIVSILIVTFLDPIKRWLSRSTDAIFFKAKINFSELIRQLSEIIAKEIEIDHLIERFTKKLAQGLKIKNSILVLEGREGVFKVRTVDHPHTKPVLFDWENPLIKYLNNHSDPIIVEELQRRVEDEPEGDKKNEIQKLLTILQQINAAAVAPIKTQEKLNAVLVLGSKLSGDVFTREDVNLIEVLSPQVASAIEKSKLYEEVKNFSKTLENKIEKATKEISYKNLELEEANKHLKQLDQAKSEFVSITSHQLRTPMTGIKGYLSMLTSGDFGKLKPEHNKLLKQLLDESERMIRLINQFLNVSKIEAGKFDLEQKEIQFEDLVAKLVKELEKPAQEKKLKLTFNKPKKKLPLIKGDSDKLSDIVLNLVDNSIKYTQKGSITVDVVKDGNNIKFSVKDTGVGIKPEDAKELFGKFHRGSGIARVQPDGSGLGLFIAKSVVEGHKGKIWVESAGEGKGSTFYFTIPIK